MLYQFENYYIYPEILIMRSKVQNFIVKKTIHIHEHSDVKKSM